MSKILVIAFELISLPGLPTGGRGVRIENIADGLKLHNHTVEFSFCAVNINFIEQTKNISIPENLKRNAHNFFFDDIIERIKPDVIFFDTWILAAHLKNKDILKKYPIIIDIHKILTLENLYRENEEKYLFFTKKIFALNKADLFCAANPRRKLYLYPLLSLAGVDLKQKPVIQCPLSCKPDLPEHKKYPVPPICIFSGVQWEWQKYGDSLRTAAEFLEKNSGLLKIFSGTFMYDDSESKINFLKKYKSVVLKDLIPHNILMEEYCNSSVAIELYEPNPERELASTTRTLEYLWSGLPVIYSKGMHFAEFIKEYDAGWVVDPVDKNELLSVLNEINLRPELCEEKGVNAQKLAKEKFNNYSAVQELSDFCDNPKKLNNSNTFISVLCGETLQKSEQINYYKNTLVPRLENKEKETNDLNREKNKLIEKISFFKNEIERLNDEKTEIVNDLNRIKNRVIFRMLLRLKKILELCRDLVLLRKL